MVERQIRISKTVTGGPGGTKRVIAIARSGGEAACETDLDVEGMSSIEEVDEDGFTVLKIRIPKVADAEGGADPLARAAGVSGAIENLEAEIGALVRRARSQGYSWTQIGAALGTSKQAAWERFSGEE